MILVNVYFIEFFLKQVYFWVLNKDEEFRRAFKLGATGVMTDYPTKLKLFLDKERIH